MNKDFDKWNEEKKKVHNRKSAPFYHRQDIWWCSFGINVGFEQDGSGDEHRRPALILKGFSVKTCLVIPLTKSTQHHRLRPSVGIVDGVEARAIISQMRVIDTKRLIRKIGYLDKKIFETIQKIAKEEL